MRRVGLTDHREKALPITVMDIEPVTGTFIDIPDAVPPS